MSDRSQTQDHAVQSVEQAVEDPRDEPPPAPPGKRGKPPEQFEAEQRAYFTAMRMRVARVAAFNRERAVKVGIKEYQWMASRTPFDCERARLNDGIIFSYLSPPPGGHPAEGGCGAGDWCRCFSRSLVPGLS